MSSPIDHREIDDRHRPLIERAWDRIESDIARLPEPLSSLGDQFFRDRRPHGRRGYFSDMKAAPLLYLPLWMRAGLQRSGAWPEPLPEDRVLDVLCGAMWGYFFIRIQDDVLDGDGARSQLLLGNVCIYEMARHFQRAVAGDPALAGIFERAWLEFTRCTHAEHEQLRSDRPYPRELFEAHAAKVAFARVPMLAICVQAGRSELEPTVSAFVHRLGIAYGLLNDVRGFARDIDNGHRTFLLAQANWTRGSALDEGVRAKLYEGGLLAAFYEDARASLEQAARLAAALGFGPELEEFRGRHAQSLDEELQPLLTLSLLRALGLGHGSRS